VVALVKQKVCRSGDSLDYEEVLRMERKLTIL